MKTALEILGKKEGGLRLYHNDIHYVTQGDALKAIEEYGKQARIDELEKILTISNSLGRNLYIAIQIGNRIKELTK